MTDHEQAAYVNYSAADDALTAASEATLQGTRDRHHAAFQAHRVAGNFHTEALERYRARAPKLGLMDWIKPIIRFPY